MITNPISMAAWRINAAKNSLIGRGDIPGLAAEDTAPRAGSNAEINNKFSAKRLQFPTNVDSDPRQGHYVIFDIKKYVPAKLEGLRAKQRTLQKALDNVRYYTGESDESKSTKLVETQLIENANKMNKQPVGSQEGGAKTNSAIHRISKQTQSSKATIAIYMPPSVSTSYKVNYGDQEIAIHTEVGLAAFEAFMAAQGGFESRAKASLDAAKSGLKDMVTKSALKMVDVIAPGARVLGQIRTGQVITPRMELMFESVERRSFTYTFIFIPKSHQEALDVEKIVYEFKHAMHPKFVGAANSIRSMEIPDTFEITYMNNASQNAFLNKISSCFLRSMDVQYGADRFTAYGETENRTGAPGSPPQRTQITLNFGELAILTQQDIEAGY